MEKAKDGLKQEFSVPFSYKVLFTTNIFDEHNSLLKENITPKKNSTVKILVVLDEGLSTVQPGLISKIIRFFQPQLGFNLLCDPVLVEGGEVCKNNFKLVMEILGHVNNFGMDRHSYLVAVGGGAVLDLVGFAAAIAHRGIRHIRIPTTVLAQNDSGVGVKNGVNLFGKKNFVGCFAPPDLVVNDVTFLRTLSTRDWIAGIAEAIKVALIKDASFFEYLESNSNMLVARKEQTMEYLVKRCAALHLEHIASGDPFEKGSSRPLDFGHWSAHKLEQETNFEIRHGEAVSIGIALDTAYSVLKGYLNEAKGQRILNLLESLLLPIYCRELSLEKIDGLVILKGLREFQEHIGGDLTIMMLKDIGKGFEVNEIDHQAITQAVLQLKKREEQKIENESKSMV